MERNIPDIIPPIDPAILKEELKEEFLLRQTNRAANHIYTFRAYQMPNVMRELGRLREQAFRYYGGGSGKEVDIDEFDLDPEGYSQLIVWDPSRDEIIGGYRYILGEDVKIIDGQPNLASGEIFHFSEEFIRDYLPQIIELGRSFVRVDYQQARLSPKSIFALDNLWDGLGALCLINPDYTYFFGKVTMYHDYNRTARDLIIYYLLTHFPDHRGLVTPIYPIPFQTPLKELQEVILGKDSEQDYKRLNSAVRKMGLNIPPLVNAYMGLSKSLVVYGTSENHEFSDVEETALIVPVEEISENKKKRHMETFLRDVASGYRSTLIQRIRRRIKL